MLLLKSNYDLFQEYKGKNVLLDQFDLRNFTVKDSSLTYRQINILDRSDGLPESRGETKTWRKFSLRELLYLSIIKDLKKYGLDNEKFTDLRKSFFGEVKKMTIPINSKRTTDLAIILSLLGKQVILRINDRYQAEYFDSETFLEFSLRERSSIVLNFSEYVFDLHIKAGEKRPCYHNLTDLLVESQELRLLKTIKEDDSQNINIARNNNGELIIRAEKYSSDKGLSDKLAQIFSNKTNETIEVNFGDAGKPRSIKQTKTYKIK